MASYFVTRHPGAVDWARAQGIEAEARAHLDVAEVGPGDRVYGILPVSLAGEICARGAHYFHLTLEVPAARRGQELSAADMTAFGARFEEYMVSKRHPEDER